MHPSDDHMPAWAREYRGHDFPPWAVTVDVVLLAADAEAADLKVVLLHREQPPFEGLDCLPGGFVNWRSDHDTSITAERLAARVTGGIRRLSSFGVYDRHGRDPRQFAGRHDESGQWVDTGVRIVSLGYLGIVSTESLPARGPQIRVASVYRHLPWEDLRDPARRATVRSLLELLTEWATSSGGDRSSRLARARSLFEPKRWNPEDVRARWDLLAEARLVEETWRDRWGRALPERPRMLFGESLAFDHREMLVDALAALRRRLRRDPSVVHALAGDEFLISELQTAVEAAGGLRLVRPNFRRLLSERGLAEKTGAQDPPTGPGRPAEYYRMPAGVRDVRLPDYLTLPWQRDLDS